MNEKVRLDLDVEEKFKLLARQLAKERKLSVSQLFEELVADEIRREKRERKEIKKNRLERILSSARKLTGNATLSVAVAFSAIDWRWWLGIAIAGALIVDAADGKLDLLGGFRLWR